MLTLLDLPLSPYAQKVKLALLEKGLPFETQLPNLDAPDAGLLAQSPRLELPVLLDGEHSLFQSSVILQYLEESYSSPALLPPTAAERARVRILEELCGTAYDAVNWGISEITIFKRAEGAQAERILEHARGQVRGLNARLERELEGRAWFNGEAFGFGDVVVYPFVNAAASLGYKPEGAKLAAWLTTMRTRPSAQRLKQDIVSTLHNYVSKGADIASGKSKRQYRDHRLDWMLRSGGLEIVLAGIQANNIRFSLEIE